MADCAEHHQRCLFRNVHTAANLVPKLNMKLCINFTNFFYYYLFYFHYLFIYFLTFLVFFLFSSLFRKANSIVIRYLKKDSFFRMVNFSGGKLFRGSGLHRLWLKVCRREVVSLDHGWV